jgi:glycine/D-amino acid oxidase-like deaminating enzyme
VPENVVIVGAGIIGCAIARDLAVRGVACAVVDDRPVAGGATQASAGMLAPYVEAHEKGPLLDLAVRSLDLYDDWVASVCRESGINVEYRRIGTLETGGPGDDRVVPEHGYVAAPQLTLALARAAERNGAAFHRARVTRIERKDAAFQIATTIGALVASHVVLAAGAWTNAIEGVVTPPLRPVRGQLLRLEWNGPPLTSIVWGPQCYVVPRLDGSILVGATVEEAGFDERNTESGIRELLNAVHTLLPATMSARVIEARVGLRPATPDELPVIGEDPQVPGLIHASGHYRNGVLLAPITARLIGDWIVDGKADDCLRDFRPDRFAREV